MTAYVTLFILPTRLELCLICFGYLNGKIISGEGDGRWEGVGPQKLPKSCTLINFYTVFNQNGVGLGPPLSTSLLVKKPAKIISNALKSFKTSHRTPPNFKLFSITTTLG